MELCERSARWVASLIVFSMLAQCYKPVYDSGPREMSVKSAVNRKVSQELNQPFKPQNSAKFNEPFPRRSKTVIVRCLEDELEIVVKADLFGTGVLVDGRDLWLGSGPLVRKVSATTCGAVASGEEFTIRAHLRDCGTMLSFTNDALVYTNTLNYSPAPSPDGVIRLDGVEVPIECHYRRRFGLDSAALVPTWIPFASTMAAEDILKFNFRLMTDDWQYERPSNVYYLGDALHLEASVTLANHVPLRVFVDHCVATPTPNADAGLKYAFIEYHGCLADGKQTGSGSQFLSRVQDEKLHFLLDAFRFYQEAGNLIYITCHLKAIPATYAVDSQNRACSFIDETWRSVDGNDQVCRSCAPSNRLTEPEPTRFLRAPSTQPLTTRPTQVSKPAQTADHAYYLSVWPGETIGPLSRGKLSEPYRGLSKRATEEWTLGPLVLLPTQEIVIPTASLTTGRTTD